MKITAMLGVALLVAQSSPQRPVRLDQLQRAARPVGVTEPSEVLFAEKVWAGADVLLPLVTSETPEVRRFALRAVGRLEDPRLVPQLLAFGAGSPRLVGDVAPAIAQSLKGFDPTRDPELIGKVSAWLRRVSFVQSGPFTSVLPGPIGRIAYANPEEVHGAEEVLRRILDDSAYARDKAGQYIAAAASLESLGRLNAKVTAFDEETTKRLVRIVTRTLPNDDLDAVREAAFAALISARALDSDTAKVAVNDTDLQVRRQAMTALAGGVAGMSDEERIGLIERALSDVAGPVRYEALKGYVRRGARTRGCGPIVSLLSDGDMNVLLAAIDALGDLCKEDGTVTRRIESEIRTPSTSGAWHREAHAFVALAKREPAAAAISMEAFATHPVWWVRMYAARAAAAAGDVPHLEKLAYDVNDNVRDAALPGIRRLKKGDGDPAIVAALERSDVQLLRTAATLLKDPPANPQLSRPLVLALLRLTNEGKETSRDARIPLLQAIAVHASADDASQLAGLLKDFDPVVAAKTAEVMTQLSGKAVTADPKPPARGWPQALQDLQQCVTVSLSSGPSFRMVMNPGAAPITVDRFLKLTTVDHYYDGLTIHRIVPNFVIQGGSPGANEYSGHKEYMRDEIGARNARGTVGLSTRGRNTADGQFYINLVDNPRLDPDYTVFASVVPGDMAVVDRIQEGDVMRLSMAKCR